MDPGEVEEIEVKMDDVIDEEEKEEYQLKGPFEQPQIEHQELKEEIIESISSRPNFEARNDEIEIPDETGQTEINTDEINARKAFLYFNDQEMRKKGEEVFDDKVKRVTEQLDQLKLIAKQRQDKGKEESKETQGSKILHEIEDLQQQANRIINPVDVNEQLLINSPIAPLAQILQKISSSDKPAGSENIVYELMYNKDCKNIMVAAKISELRKRINTMQKWLSNWGDKKSAKYKDLSHMLMITQDQIKFMREKELNAIFGKTRKLFKHILEAQESKEMEELVFDAEPVNQIKEIVGNDKEDSDTIENDIQRLESLRNVHEDSAEIFNKIKALQQSQANMISGLKEDKDSLQYVKDSLRENVSIIKENMENIKARISKLKS